MNTCKICLKDIPNKRVYCSNKCKFSDPVYNLSRMRDKKIVSTFKLKCKICEHTTLDIVNASGHLRNHIEKTHGIMYIDANTHYIQIEKEHKDKIKCPECKWSTVDVKNKSGWFTTHIKTHGYTIDSFIAKYPDYSKIWNRYIHNADKITESSIICLLCGEQFHKLSNTHMKQVHGMTIPEYKERFPTAKILSDRLHKLHSEITTQTNLSRNYSYRSKEEVELEDYIKSLGITTVPSYKKLGTELDIFIPDKNIAIEYNGLYWHSEYNGKKHKNYHLNKTELCEKSNIHLIHIFQDEWLLKKDLVKKKLAHLLGKNVGDKIYARKTQIRSVSGAEVKEFLNNNHIQGFQPAKYHFGSYYNNRLVAVMSLSELRKALGAAAKKDTLEIVRYATDVSTICIGMFSKFISHITKVLKISTLLSYADRRWTKSCNNIYTKNNFTLNSISGPNYWYIKGMKKYHRFNFTKSRIVNKLHGDKNKTEWENMLDFKFDRIWDCGMLKYTLAL